MTRIRSAPAKGICQPEIERRGKSRQEEDERTGCDQTVNSALDSLSCLEPSDTVATEEIVSTPLRAIEKMIDQ